MEFHSAIVAPRTPAAEAPGLGRSDARSSLFGHAGSDNRFGAVLESRRVSAGSRGTGANASSTHRPSPSSSGQEPGPSNAGPARAVAGVDGESGAGAAQQGTEPLKDFSGGAPGDVHRIGGPGASKPGAGAPPGSTPDILNDTAVADGLGRDVDALPAEGTGPGDNGQLTAPGRTTASAPVADAEGASDSGSAVPDRAPARVGESAAPGGEGSNPTLVSADSIPVPANAGDAPPSPERVSAEAAELARTEPASTEQKDGSIPGDASASNGLARRTGASPTGVTSTENGQGDQTTSRQDVNRTPVTSATSTSQNDERVASASADRRSEEPPATRPDGQAPSDGIPAGQGRAGASQGAAARTAAPDTQMMEDDGNAERFVGEEGGEAAGRREENTGLNGAPGTARGAVRHAHGDLGGRPVEPPGTSQTPGKITATAVGASSGDSGTESHGPAASALRAEAPQTAPPAGEGTRPTASAATLRAEQALEAEREYGSVVGRLRDNGEMRLALRPQGLGELEVRVAVRDGGVRANVAAAHEEARQLLASQRHDLEIALHRYNLRLDGFSVDVGGRDGKPSAQQEAQESVPGHWGSAALVEQVDGEEMQPPPTGVRGTGGGGLSLRV